MPSDERSQHAMGALASARETFRSAVAQAVDEVHGLIAQLRTAEAGGRERHAAALGAFAAGRINVERFAAVFGQTTQLEPDALAVMEKSRAVLAEIAAWSEAGFFVNLEPGRDLRGAVAAALAMAGRAFGAARVIQLARTRRFHGAEHAAWLDAFPSEHWNRAERQIAPPLVVRLAGGDLRAGDLAGFMEGTQKLVLVVDQPAPPAPLVRLITPAVLVAQVADPANLVHLLAFDGPAAIALMPGSAARFVYHPAPDGPSGARLVVEHMPQEEVRGRVGQLSAFQQNEELRQLAALAVAAADREERQTPATVPAGVEPADQLASWLLRQAGLAET